MCSFPPQFRGAGISLVQNTDKRMVVLAADWFRAAVDAEGNDFLSINADSERPRTELPVTTFQPPGSSSSPNKRVCPGLT